MARKMGPNGPKLQIREKNGHYYAYKSTSRMVDGKKKTINECLGVYDPETGAVTPKKPMKSREEYERIRAEMNPAIDFSKVGSRSYGGVYLLDGIQRRIHLGEDLSRSFGLSAKAIMTCAMALTVNPGPFSSIGATFENTYLRDLYGTEIPVASPDMSMFTNNIGKSDMCIDDFFSCRITRCGGLVAWDTTTNSTHSDLDGMAEWAPNKDGENLPVVKRAMATDLRGVPLMFRFYPGSLSDLATVKRLEDDIRRYGRDDALFVMDRGFCSGWNLQGMLKAKRRMVVPAKLEFKAVKTALTEFRKSAEKESRVFDGHAYTVWRTEVGLRASGRTLSDGSPAFDLTSPGEEGHAADGVMAAYVVYDSKKYSDEVQSRELLIDSLMEYARNMDEADPVKAFKKRAGKAIRYFSVEMDGRRVALTVKKNARSFVDNRAGMFVMLCSQDVSWELMMAAYDARRLTEQAFDSEKERDDRLRSGNSVTLEGRYLIQFVSQIMLAEIRAVVREKDLADRYPVQSLLATLSTLNVLEYGERKGLSEVTKNVRRILEVFDLDVPSVPLYHADMFDLSALLHPVAKGDTFEGRWDSEKLLGSHDAITTHRRISELLLSRICELEGSADDIGEFTYHGMVTELPTCLYLWLSAMSSGKPNQSGNP